VIGEFSDVPHDLGGKLAEAAESELTELHEGIRVGQLARDINGIDQQGRPFKLSEYAGKVVLLIFSGRGCGRDCVADIYPRLSSLSTRWHEPGLEVLGVIKEVSPSEAPAVFQQNGITWRCWCDAKGSLFETWNIRNWPVVYLIDRQGVVRYRNVRGEAIARAVESLMQETR